MRGMNTFNEALHPRNQIGRFTEKPQSAPELSLSAPVVINSPATGGYRANLAIHLADGETLELNAHDSGIADAGGDSLPGGADDTFRFTREGDEVKVTFAVKAEEEEAELRAVLTELTEEDGEDLILQIRRDIADASGGTVDLILTDDSLEVRHVSRHPLDEGDYFHTANIVSDLESDRGYLYVTAGNYLPAVWAHLQDRHAFA